MSHPSRGGWIEIVAEMKVTGERISPTPHGVGGLKLKRHGLDENAVCPTPHEVGGLKYRSRADGAGRYPSHPSRGGWIEMESRLLCNIFGKVPPLTGWVD